VGTNDIKTIVLPKSQLFNLKRKKKNPLPLLPKIIAFVFVFCGIGV
jgi:hypothetical protein